MSRRLRKVGKAYLERTGRFEYRSSIKMEDLTEVEADFDADLMNPRLFLRKISFKAVCPEISSQSISQLVSRLTTLKVELSRHLEAQNYPDISTYTFEDFPSGNPQGGPK